MQAQLGWQRQADRDKLTRMDSRSDMLCLLVSRQGGRNKHVSSNRYEHIRAVTFFYSNSTTTTTIHFLTFPT